MAEIEGQESGNPRLKSNGKRDWAPRLGITNPALRKQQLWDEDQEHDVDPGTPKRTFNLEIEQPGKLVRRDIPMDAADQAEEKRQSR